MNGVINIFKPKGMTSFDVVREVKKICSTGKVGHTGTLDPEATGVLPVCIGRATKIIDYIMDSRKVYEVEFKLGIKTTTYDDEGEILETRETSHLTDEEILEAIKSFLGEYSQIPPMYSALKQNGVRLYTLARQGIEVERKSRHVDIGFIKINEMNLDDDVITNASRIIILKLEEKGTIGIIVDEVKEVVTLCTDEIDKTSGSKDGKAMFINGVGKHGDELISLFEISAIVEEKENA